MRKWSGVSLRGVLAAAALAFPAGAAAGYSSPTLALSSGPGATTTISLVQSVGDASTGKVTIYAPVGYAAATARRPGVRIGRVEARGLALGGTELRLSGPIVVDDPVAYEASPCSPGLHAAVWRLALRGGGTTFEVPVLVDPAFGPETAFASLKLQLCLPSPDLPVESGGAPLGAKLTTLELSVAGVFREPSLGSLVWRSVWTPYVPLTARQDLPASLESRSRVRVPIALAIGPSRAGTSTRVTGRLTRAGIGVGGATIAIWTGPRRGALTRTGAVVSGRDGSFAFATPARASFARAAAVVAPRPDPWGCRGGATFPPIRCVTATRAGFSVVSPVVRLG